MKDETLTRLLRSDLGALRDYAPAHGMDPRRVIKLDANENPYGPSPRVLTALAAARTWQFYCSQDEARAQVAQYAGVNPENIVLTNGGDEAIDLVLRAILEPHEVVLDAPPSFEMYRIFTLANRGRVCEVARREDFTLDTDAVIRAAQTSNIKALCLASPNNPDGGLLPRADLLRLLELPALVLMDEAYFEFAGTSAVDLAARYPNLVIVRTFSKWAGLAGLRVGYLIAAPALARALHTLRAPYNVNEAGLLAARESLLDVKYLMNNVRAIIAERERMRIALSKFEWLTPLPSCTNFLLLRVAERQPQAIKQALAQRGILIRAFQTPRLRDYIRISVGAPAMNDAALNALREL
ncbi:MAG: Histidinol-phosphate aminotransferase [Anaerolineae bacterium]|nr:Histidinol-phosphate aminotransferase [Anaerolineae bacterium]